MDRSCAFCREQVPENDSEWIKRYEERVDKGDLEAMVSLAAMYRYGQYGLVRDEAKALELLQRAADLGCPDALGMLAYYFFNGEGGVIQDWEKARIYLEDATKKGNAVIRYNLGLLEEDRQHHDLAIRHYKLAAAGGEKESTKQLWNYYSSDKLTKADLEATLRAHHSACDEMNSEDRERYEAWQKAKAGDDEILQDIYKGYYEGLITAKELKAALKVHGRGDVHRVKSFLSKCWRKG